MNAPKCACAFGQHCHNCYVPLDEREADDYETAILAAMEKESAR